MPFWWSLLSNNSVILALVSSLTKAVFRGYFYLFAFWGQNDGAFEVLHYSFLILLYLGQRMWVSCTTIPGTQCFVCSLFWEPFRNRWQTVKMFAVWEKPPASEQQQYLGRRGFSGQCCIHLSTARGLFLQTSSRSSLARKQRAFSWWA